MKATIMYGAGDVRVESVPDARILQPTDAVVAITRSCICGSDLWPYRQMERNDDGVRMGHEFIGVVEEVGDEAVERVRELSGGFGAHSALECVGFQESTLTAVSIARPGGAVGRVGVPQGEAIPAAQSTFYRNVTIAGGPAPVRAYIEELLPDVLEGRIEPAGVFDRVIGLDQVADGYRAMDERRAIKVLIK